TGIGSGREQDRCRHPALRPARAPEGPGRPVIIGPGGPDGGDTGTRRLPTTVGAARPRPPTGSDRAGSGAGATSDNRTDSAETVRVSGRDVSAPRPCATQA